MSNLSPEISPETLDQTAQNWFCRMVPDGEGGQLGLHRLDQSSPEVAQLESSIANALGYDLTDMSSYEDREDFSVKTGTLILFSAMHDPESGFVPEIEEAEVIRRATRDIVRDVIGLAIVENVHNRDMEQSYRDTMTDALNERGLNRYLRRRFGIDTERGRNADNSKETPQEVDIADDDLTNFKRINQVLGEARGDDAIKEAYDELEDQLRLSDDLVIARYRRGDEFELIMLGLSLEERDAIDRRLLESQAAKVINGRYTQAWSKIYGIRDRLLGSGLLSPNTPLPTVVKMEDMGDGVERRILYVAGERMFPLRDIVIHSIGFARGSIQSWEDHASLHEEAARANKQRKTVLHAMMGGADRPS